MGAHALRPVKRLREILGPGLITGASDVDPSAIGTLAIAGASFGYSTLWLVLAIFPLLAAVQFICAKIGMVSGIGLAGVLRRHYTRRLFYPVVLGVLLANTMQAGADIGAIAAAVALLVPLPTPVMVVSIACGILALLLWGPYRLIERLCKGLTLALCAYIAAAFLAQPDPLEVLTATVVPVVRLDRRFLATLVALLGSMLSPYLYFWQASQEVEGERRLSRGPLGQRQGATDAELRERAWDVRGGMFFAVVVAYFIVLTTGATLFRAGHTEVLSAAEAAEALRPLAGNAAQLLFTVGLVGAGLLAVPVLTGSAAYAVADALGWRASFDERPRRAKRFYAVMALSALSAMGINFVGINPIRALFWAGVINGLLAPPLLAIIMCVANEKAIMGDRVNTPGLNFLGWAAVGLMFAAVIGLIWTWASS